MKFLPAIDILGGRVVRLKQGREDAVTVYAEDPVEQALAFAGDGAEYLHVVDLDAAFGRPGNGALIARIAKETPLRVQVGGGIRDLVRAQSVVDHGAWRFVIGSAAIQNPGFVAKAVAKFGGQVVVGLDAKGGEIRIQGWTKGTGRQVTEVAREMVALGVKTIVYTDIARDGMMGEPDVDGAVALARDCGCRVVVSGGVSNASQIAKMAAHPEVEHLDGVISGRALYEGTLTVAGGIDAVMGRSDPGASC